jgi:uncharacterized protein
MSSNVRFRKKPLALVVSAAIIGPALLMSGCNSDGTSASSGQASTVTATRTLAAIPGCSNGGIEVTSGIDANSNGLLDASEVQDTQYVCNGQDGLAYSMSFAPVSVPTTDAQKSMNRASSEVTIDQTTYAIGYNALMRTNEEMPLLGGGASDTIKFGALIDKAGNVMKDASNNDVVCTNGSGPDHTSMLTFGDKLFAVTQLECALGGAYVTELNQDGNGNLSAVATRPVDFSSVNGTYVNCAGQTTPWNTHLGSEEYEPPMSDFNASATGGAWFNDPGWNDLHMQTIADYNGLTNDAANAAYFGYYYGWVPEISITSASGDTRVVKHYAMGRFAHELAYVLPDKKTVYMSDDEYNVGLYMYVADTAEDLSAGTLYAAHWIQESGVGAGSASIEWINLGHATDAEVGALLTSHTTFDDMWDKADPTDAATGTCPAGYTSVNVYTSGLMCVNLKRGMDLAASRLETRLYAAYKGATMEFRKEEGITFNPDNNVLYVAMSEIGRGMEDNMKYGTPNTQYDVGGHNDIRLDANLCGAVYGLNLAVGALDSAGGAIDSNYVVGDMRGVLEGRYLGKTAYDGTAFASAQNDCDLNAISMPDNLSYLPKYGMLLIGEDTSHHQNDMLWAYNVKTQALQRIATTPFGSETTSPFWHTNVNGYGYVTMVTQHPFGESDSDKAASAADFESYVGYIGPFPALSK